MVRALNVSKETIIASDLKEAAGFLPRLLGLIGRDSLEENEGLWMARCRAIHTFWMRFPLDVVFLDRDGIVKKTVKGLRPFRPVVSCRHAQGVLELPEGTIERARIQIGDRVKII
ncbi:MAG: DUF192 domain-containing protein [Nitrospirae bacterium]|nr:DUF192 domain-containing protein [Nitrospirota bacterium]